MQNPRLLPPSKYALVRFFQFPASVVVRIKPRSKAHCLYCSLFVVQAGRSSVSLSSLNPLFVASRIILVDLGSASSSISPKKKCRLRNVSQSSSNALFDGLPFKSCAGTWLASAALQQVLQKDLPFPSIARRMLWQILKVSEVCPSSTTTASSSRARSGRQYVRQSPGRRKLSDYLFQSITFATCSFLWSREK